MSYQPLKTPYVIDWIRGSSTAPQGLMNETESFGTLPEAVAALKARRNAYELRVCVLPDNHSGGCADCWTVLAKRNARKPAAISVTPAGKAFGVAI